MVDPIVGCYVLHLYCTNGLHVMRQRAEYTGRNRREAIKAAQADGWSISLKSEIAICPDCQRKEGACDAG